MERGEVESWLRSLPGWVRAAHPRSVRRVARAQQRLPLLSVEVPHAEVCCASAAQVLEELDAAEAGLRGVDPAAQVVLVAWSGEEDAQTLWRRVFHGLLDRALDGEVSAGRLGPLALRRCAQRLGSAEVAEARRVLRAEGRLGETREIEVLVRELAAFYYEHARFEPEALPLLLPSLGGAGEVEAALRPLLDDAPWLEIARPPWAAPLREGPPPAAAALPPAAAPPVGEAAGRGLLASARAARAEGNDARALVEAFAATGARGEVGEAARAAHAEAWGSLRGRLGRAASVEASSAALEQLEEALGALCAASVGSPRGPSARLLMDLQAACVEAEREAFRIDLWGWAQGLGRRPLLLALPARRAVASHRRLRRAAGRAGRCALPGAQGEALREGLEALAEASERHLRAVFGPRMAEALAEAGLRPVDPVEEVAAARLVAELCDVIVRRGFIHLSDLRDAVARSPLKLPDLAPRELLGRDVLLRLDVSMDDRLDDVYRRGEVYLRALQRTTSVAFGTGWGRASVLWAALPLGGGFLVTEGVYHLIAPAARLVRPEVEVAAPPLWVWGVVSAVLLALLHAPRLRGAAWRGAKAAAGAAVWLARLPARLARQPWVRRVVESRPVRAALQGVIKPGVPWLVAWWLARWGGWSAQDAALLGVAAFLGAFVVANSRLGRRLEEAAFSVGTRASSFVFKTLVPGLVGWTLQVFRALVERVERGLYAVDEWLRFKSTDTPPKRWVKGVGWALWSVAAYGVRMLITLMVEPQINPIKHFPVVTVSHKLTLPVALPLTRSIAGVLAPLGKVLANALAGGLVTLMPGVFGFLAWEFKENWRLYAANRPRRLGAVSFGDHGEDVVGMLRPGFHSGTVPKRFGRLRRAERRRGPGGSAPPADAVRREIEALGASFARFVEREVVWLWRQDGRLEAAGVRLEAPRVELGSTRALIVLPAAERAPLRVALEERDGWLLARVQQAGWLAEVAGEAREVARLGLVGLYVMAGVDLVEEHLAAHLAPGWEVACVEGELVLWREPAEEVRVPLRRDPPPGRAELPPRVSGLAGRLVLSEEAHLSWAAWVRAWSTPGVAGEILPGWRLLPGVTSSEEVVS